MNYNKVMIGGRLTKDPELRYTPSGTAVTDLGVAVNRYYNDKSGQKQEETCFIDVVLWQKQAELCHKYLHKGSPIFIEGRLTFETWEGRDGQKRSRLKVVGERMQFVDGARGQDTGQSEEASPAASYQGPPIAAEPLGQENESTNSKTPELPF